MSKQNVPPEAAQFFDRLFTGQGVALIMFAVVVPLFALFGMLGSLLGLVFFRKKLPPPQPPAQPPLVG